jgi:hypothetical protein
MERPKKQVVVVYHAVDADGWSSAYIAGRAYPDDIVTYEGYDYSWNTVNLLKAIPKGATVVAVDISFDEFTFAEIIEKASEVVWIDHHISAIRKLDRAPFSTLPGIRKEGDCAACELAWEYYNPGKPMPYVIQMIGKADRKEREPSDLYYVKAMLGQFLMRPGDINWNLWDELIQFENKEALMAHPTWGAEFELGIKLHEFQRNTYAIRARQAFVLGWEGYSVLACNTFQVGPEFFESRANPNIDFFMCFHRQPNGTWRHTLYNNHLSPKEIDLSKIAEKHGGGGHPLGAGFIRKTPIPQLMGTVTLDKILEAIEDIVKQSYETHKPAIDILAEKLAVAASAMLAAKELMFKEPEDLCKDDQDQLSAEEIKACVEEAFKN